MRRLWRDYEGAIKALKSDKREKLTRNEATELLEISTGVFAREVRCNSMFIAKYNPEITSTATYYNRKDLIKHFERLRDEEELGLLIYHRYALSDKEFEKVYENPKKEVFAPGTYLIVGGEN